MGWIVKVWVTFRLSELPLDSAIRRRSVIAYIIILWPINHLRTLTDWRCTYEGTTAILSTVNTEIKLPNLWDSSVGIVARLWAGRFGVRIQTGAGYFSLLQKSTLTLNPTQPPIQPCFFSEVRAEGRDVGHSPAVVELKNEWSCTPSPHTCFYSVDRNIYILAHKSTTNTWRYSPSWALASCASRLRKSLSWAFSLYPSISIARNTNIHWNYFWPEHEWANSKALLPYFIFYYVLSWIYSDKNCIILYHLPFLWTLISSWWNLIAGIGMF